MQIRTLVALVVCILLWASAFVGIRAGLVYFSPEGLALLRYLTASVCLFLIYSLTPSRHRVNKLEVLLLLLSGALGIGLYNLTLNYGEMNISSGISSFIVGQSPLLTLIFAILFLNELVTPKRIMGFLVSIVGIGLISFGESTELQWNPSFWYIIVATVLSSFYSITQKPFLKRHHPVIVTSYLIWGGTLFLLFYLPSLKHDLVHVPWQGIMIAIYLGVFPAAIAYLAWNYVLSKMPVSEAVSYFYFLPVVTTLMGWIVLAESPSIPSLVGGLLALVGILLANQSVAKKKVESESMDFSKPIGSEI